MVVWCCVHVSYVLVSVLAVVCLEDLPLGRGGPIKRLHHQPRALVVLDVRADLLTHTTHRHRHNIRQSQRLRVM
jgi:hypothetical protein